ncbi:DUF5684 domain-containing protein [Oribacterium sp. WCC10]|uniref:DUF5684 domain-containing protein n=1 Tax=Oribacterium sp. WCC10 TaxID=1855343 RepID=UPI0008E57C97|nr:DUF5684 domain-containing protein [Oribacterium sp. WCC10]SFG26762.1 hypothetical protein SAMN05216356_104164 [Oribacterium sp. WCC10]
MSDYGLVTLMGGLLIVMIIFLIFLLALLAIEIFARWKIFEKAGIPGWSALIPFYSDYCMFKLAWKKDYFWLFLIIEILTIVCEFIKRLRIQGDNITSTVGAGLSLVLFIFTLFLYINLARKFGHGIAFGVGTKIFPYIFLMILALGDDRYLGNPEEGLYTGMENHNVYIDPDYDFSANNFQQPEDDNHII